jgi:hypothetical protein
MRPPGGTYKKGDIAGNIIKNLDGIRQASI